MNRSQPNLINLSFLVCMAALISFAVGFMLPQVKHQYEEKIGSLIWALLPSEEVEERITIVAIDETSLAKVGPWPWPRTTMADLSNRLAEYGSAAQMFDIVFPETKTGDDLLSQALVKNRGIIAQVPVLDSPISTEPPLRTGVLAGAIQGTTCQPLMPATQSYLGNAPSIAARTVGHITPIIDQDGVIRKQPPLICVDGQVYPSLALQGLLSSLANNSPSVAFERDLSLISSDWSLVLASYFGLSVPVDHDGNMRLSYRQSPASFQVVSAADVLDGSVMKELLENRWVLVGATAFGLGDVMPTPHQGRAPGVELQARLLSNLLDGTTPFTPSYAKYLLWFEGLLFAGALLVLARSKSKLSAYGLPTATVILPVLAWALHSYLLLSNIWLGWFTVALFALFAGAMLTLANHRMVRYQHLHVFNYLSSYLPKSVAESLMHAQPSNKVSAEHRDLVLMCADLRNFSAFEEACSAEASASVLHDFFITAGRVIETNGGQIDEYRGDALLASWPTEPGKNACQAALNAAEALQAALEDVIPVNLPKGLEPLALGIGIERGSTLVGSIGPKNRRHHSLLGETVTIAIRLQEMTQDLAQPILIGECAARSIQNGQLESQGSFLLEGLTTPHVLFVPISGHTDAVSEKTFNRVVKIVSKR